MKLLHIFWFPIFMLFLPIILIYLFVLLVYRACVSIHLTDKYGKRFKGLLDGKDVFFTFGGDEGKGILVILTYICVEKAKYEPGVTFASNLKDLRRRFIELVLSGKLPKFLYRRQYEFGYFYWLDEDPGPIEKYVMELDFGTSGEFITMEDLRRTASSLTNFAMPDGNTRNWDLRIGNKPIVSGDVMKFPAMFRASHCVGDGVALMRFLTEIVSDDPDIMNTIYGQMNDLRPNNISAFNRFLRGVLYQIQVILFYAKHIVKLILFTPYKVIDQFLKPLDENAIHPERLTGDKVVYWIHEADTNIPLLDTMKKIRRKYPKTKFNDVVATLTARALQVYFDTKQMKPPKYLTAIFLERIAGEGANVELQNKSSHVEKTMPIGEVSTLTHLGKEEQFLTLMNKIKKDGMSLQEDYELFVNSFLSFLPGLLPGPLARAMCTPVANTICVCNVPGPLQKLKINGNDMDDFLYWSPTMGRVGISLNFFSYGQQLELSIAGDTAALATEADAALIVNAVVKEIKDLKDALNL